MEGQKESPECSVYAVKNTRRLMEDRHVVLPNLLSQFKDKCDNPNHYSYYAIFDGHAGPDAAQFAADNLHKNLVESSFFKAANIEDAFRYAYATTDFQYAEKSMNDRVRAGCTSVTCLLENSRRLYLAWAGDSVAILSRNGKPVFVMDPHNLERDDEKERVQAMGGVVLLLDTWRVNGTLGVSRAIGDPEYKPYVCSDPDIECIDLDGTEDFLIIGCDGLWDRMTPEDAIGSIYEHLASNSHLGVNEIVNSTAQMLSNKSIKDGSSDNVTTIVVFLKPVSSLLNSMSGCVNGDKIVSASQSNNLVDNNHHGLVDYGNHGDQSNGNTIESNNGLIDDYLYQQSQYERSSVLGKDNGLRSEEAIGSGGISDGGEGKKWLEEEERGGGGGEKREADEKEDEKDGEEEKVNSGCSALNPFADEFQPNISNKNQNIGEIGNEPKKDEEEDERRVEKGERGEREDEESHKNEKLDKKDLWMSERRDDGNNVVHDQQDDHDEHHPDHHHQHQHHYSQPLDHNEAEREERERGMFDGLVINENLSYGGGLGNQQSTGNYSSSEYEDNLSSEMIIHDIDENKSEKHHQQPSSSESVFTEQQHQLSSTMESNLISQADTFVGNLTPNEVPSSPIVTTSTSTTTSTTSSSQQQNEFTFDCQQSSDVNQYITSVSDGMVSDPYHDPYFANDSVEPQSIILNRSGDVISSGPHAIDPYSEKDDKLESVLTREGEMIGREGGEGGDGGDGAEGAEEKDEYALNSSTGKINIEDTQSIPLESLNPFDCGGEAANNMNPSVNEPHGVDISTGGQNENEKFDSEAPATASEGVESGVSATASAAAVATAVAAAAVVTGASGALIAGVASKAGKTVEAAKKETTKMSVVKKSTLTSTTRAPTARTGSVATSKVNSSSSTTTTSAARKPLSGKSSTSRQPTSTSTTSTSNVKSSSSTSRVGSASTLNKRPTQTLSSSSSTTSRVSLASRATTSTAARGTSSSLSSSSSATAKPLTRTSTTTTATARVPTSRSTVTSRLTSAPSRTTPFSSSTTATKSTISSTSASRKGTATGTAKTSTIGSKRASTGTMLTRPSPGASSLANKSTTSAMNRSLTSSSSSSPRPGTTSSTSSASRLSTRPTTTTRTPLSRPLGTKSTTPSSSSTASKTTKSTTSSNKVAVPRPGAAKKSGTTGVPSTDASSTISKSEEDSTPGDAFCSNSMKREKNLMENSHSLKDELEAALASPISGEDKGVIEETKDDESSENL